MDSVYATAPFIGSEVSIECIMDSGVVLPSPPGLHFESIAKRHRYGPQPGENVGSLFDSWTHPHNELPCSIVGPACAKATVSAWSEGGTGANGISPSRPPSLRCKPLLIKITEINVVPWNGI